jgi:hypothetical protein
MELLRFGGNLAEIVWTKFETRSQFFLLLCVFENYSEVGTEFKTRSSFLGLSFKLDSNFLLIYSTPSPFLFHLLSANNFFKIAIVTVARALN